MIPLFKVNMSKDAGTAVSETLMSGYIGEGQRVKDFEKALEPYLGQKVLALNSCTSALRLALRLLDVGPGDEVISTPMTCTATNMPIIETGAKIVWADVDPRSGNIDAVDVARKVTDKTKAVMCMHWGGNVCNLDGLQLLGLPIIQDAAHAFGATYKGLPLSAWSQFTCFSFQAIKHLTTVDGGALVCNEEDWNRGRLLRWYGIDRETGRTDARCEDDIKESGYKYHMNDVNATIGLENLKHINPLLLRCTENAAFYTSTLSKWIVDFNSYARSYPWLMSLLVPDSEAFLIHMREAGIGCSKVHVRNDLHTAFKPYLRAFLPGVTYFSEHQVAIPVGWWVTNEERKYISDTAYNFLKGYEDGNTNCMSKSIECNS